MPFRFFQRIRNAPSLTLNLSKGVVYVSAGAHGAKFTLDTSGTRATVGLPDSGLHYTPCLTPIKDLEAKHQACAQNIFQRISSAS